MKSILNRVLVLLVTVSLTGVLALAKTTEKEVIFAQSLTVNGTLVKKGTYRVAINDETGELTIRKGKKILATAQVRLEKTSERNIFYTHSEPVDPTTAPALVTISLRDGNLATIVDSKAASSKP